MSVSMQYSTTTITIATPEYPNDPRVDIDQFRSRAMGGRVVSVTRSLAEHRNPVLHWANMTDADYALLQGFIFTTVNGAQLAFTFTDWNSVAWTAVYLGGLETAAATGYGTWAVDLQLALS